MKKFGGGIELLPFECGIAVRNIILNIRGDNNDGTYCLSIFLW